jgi:hypothetical protein
MRLVIQETRNSTKNSCIATHFVVHGMPKRENESVSGGEQGCGRVGGTIERYQICGNLTLPQPISIETLLVSKTVPDEYR